MKSGLRIQIKKLAQDPRNLFYLISAAGILLYFLLSLPLGGRLYAWMVQENAPEIRFIDYFPHLDDASDRLLLYQHAYSDAQSSYAPLFPPLAYLMYHLLYRITSIPGKYSPELMGAESIPGALSVFTIYLIFNAVLFLLAIGITGRKSRRKDLLLFTLLMLSAVFAGSGYMTGNSAMLVLALLMAALQLKDSPNAFRRELGLLLLAICVAMKIYPAVFGLVFLKEKRYKELGRLILYSLLLLFVPFFFFGGLPAIQDWISNLLRPLQSSDYGRPQYLKGLFFSLIRDITGQEAPALSTILTVAVSLLWVWMAWRSKSLQRTYFFLICIMVFFPSNSFRYTLAFFSVPLVMMLKEEKPVRTRFWPEGLTSALYGLLYTVPVWWLAVIPMDRRFDIYTLTSVEIYLYLIAYALVAVTMIAEFGNRKEKTGKPGHLFAESSMQLSTRERSKD